MGPHTCMASQQHRRLKSESTVTRVPAIRPYLLPYYTRTGLIASRRPLLRV